MDAKTYTPGCGIDFGNEYCKVFIATDELSEPTMLHDADVMSFSEGSGSYGVTAENSLIRDWKNAIFSFKRLLSKKETDIDPNLKQFLPSSMIIDEEGNISFSVTKNDQKINYTLKQAYTNYLKYLKSIIDSKCGTNVKDLVFSIPVEYTEDKECEFLKECIKSAGFNLLSFIKEPTAVLLSYIEKNKENNNEGENDMNGNYLIIDIGGSRCSCSLLNNENGIIKIIKYKNTYDIGCKYIDVIIANHLADEFERKYRGSIEIKTTNMKAMKKIMKYAKEARYCLSSSNISYISIESLADGVDFTTQLSSARFDILIQSQLTKLSSFITDFLSSENIPIESLKGVIPCGGGYKINSIKLTISKIFQESSILIKDQISSSISPEEIISFGCGLEVKIQKYNININNKQLSSISCLSKSIYLDGKDKKILLFNKNTPIPVMKEISIKVGEECSVLFKGYEKNNNEDEDYIPLFEFAINDLIKDEILSTKIIINTKKEMVFDYFGFKSGKRVTFTLPSN